MLKSLPARSAITISGCALFALCFAEIVATVAAAAAVPNASEASSMPPQETFPPWATSVPLDELLGNSTVYDGSEETWDFGGDTIPIVQNGRTEPLTYDDLENVTMIASGYKEAFLLFVQRFKREYKDNAELQRRYKYFVLNMAGAFYNQTANPDALFGANNFSDLTPTEFLPYRNLSVAFDRFLNASAGAHGGGTTSAANPAASASLDGFEILQNSYTQDYALYDTNGEYAAQGRGREHWGADPEVELVQSAKGTAASGGIAIAGGESPTAPATAARKVFTPEDTTTVPTTLDWRKYGAVSAVEEQGYCGGCWAFATAGNIEGVWKIAGYSMTVLSPQNLLSCDLYSGNLGCAGGVMQYAYNFLLRYQNGYISRLDSYPYKSIGGSSPYCDSNLVVPGAQIDSYVVISRDENVMMDYVANVGPIAVAIDSTSWQSYIGGIITNCISYRVDHAVLIVGYSTTWTPPYWIVKNSWGKTWGEQGYVRIAKGTDQCLITRNPTTAFVPLKAKLPTPAPTNVDGSIVGGTDPDAPSSSAPTQPLLGRTMAVVCIVAAWVLVVFM